MKDPKYCSHPKVRVKRDVRAIIDTKENRITTGIQFRDPHRNGQWIMRPVEANVVKYKRIVECCECGVIVDKEYPFRG